MKVLPGLLTAVALTCSTAPAQSYMPSGAVLNNLKAHALAYTGRPCGPKIKAQAPRPMTPDQFYKFADFMDTIFQTMAKKMPTTQVKSTMPDKDNLYRAYIVQHEGGVQRAEFIIMYLDVNQVYAYGCDLK